MRDYLVGRHEGMPDSEAVTSLTGRSERVMARPPMLLAVVVAEDAADAVQQVVDELRLDHEARFFAVPVQDFAANLELKNISVELEA